MATPIKSAFPFAIPSTAWQTSPLTANTNSATTYQRIGNTNSHGSPDWVIATSTIGTTNPGLTVPFPGPNPVPITPITANFVNGTWTGNITLFQLATNLTLIADDANGHIGSSTTFTVAPDTQPPSITCSTNRIVIAPPGQCATNVNFIVTASDNCLVTNLVSNPASGSAFPVGITTVTNRVTDASGNTTACTFTVTVLDTRLRASLALQTSSPTLRRGCAVGWSISLRVPPTTVREGSCQTRRQVALPFRVGVTTVTNTARDDSGNRSSCTFTVTVLDNQAPAITCPANLAVNASPDQCASNVTFTVTATDNCAVTNLASVPPSGSAFPVGVTTVTNTAQGQQRQQRSCTFTVTVLDTQPPVITCPANLIVNAPPGRVRRAT